MNSSLDESKPLAAPASAISTGVPWGPIAWFGILLLISYVAVLQALGAQWLVDDDVSHGPFVPVVAAYILWQRRAELASTEWKANYYGLFLVGWGIIQFLIGSIGAELFLQRTSLLVTLTGIILTLGGTKVLKIFGFPLFLLVFMIPLPKVIYGRITLPLQLFASARAADMLDLIGTPVFREGNIIEVGGGKLDVVEACSGIRSLMALSFLSLVYGFFFDNKPWMKWLLLLATIPIAIAANASRVAITAVLTNVNPELARGAFHEMEGFLVFAIAILLLLAVHQTANFIYHRTSSSSKGPLAV